MVSTVILAINPGSTSTKIALFESETERWSETQRYDAGMLAQYAHVTDQEEFRYQEILKALAARGEEIAAIGAFVARGGLLRPMEGGTYEISQVMVEELKSRKWGEHASNLAAPIAVRLAQAHGRPAFIVDPVVVDELTDVAHVSGLPELPRKSIFHALNQKAVARRAAAKRGGKPEDYNFVVCHMGGGVSVAAHKKGRVVEVNDALGGEGPMSPERAGSVPVAQLVDLCFSGTSEKAEITRRLIGRGGFVAHLGTNDFREIMEKVAQGDEKAKLVFDAFCYQLGKAIGGCAVVLEGKVDAILLTGGLAYNEELCRTVDRAVSWIAPVEVFPGEDEMRALAEGALRVLRGEERAKAYE